MDQQTLKRLPVINKEDFPLLYFFLFYLIKILSRSVTKQKNPTVH